MKHILVTGGNGFIGGYVVEQLRKFGYEVSILDRHQWATYAEIPPPYTQQLFFGDIKDATLVTDAVSHVDGVIHLAGVLGTQETIENPLPAAETNILGGLNVINACAQYDVPLINIAVGNYWMDNTYSITKSTVERMVRMTQKYRGKAMASVRALNAYGPRQVPTPPYGSSRVRKIMPSFVCRALTGEPIEIYGDGEQIMDMIHARDVANVLVTALEHLDSHGAIETTVEAGTGKDITVNDVAEAVASATLGLTDRAVTVSHLPMRPGEEPGSVVKADTSTLSVIGIDPAGFTLLTDGVFGTVEYFKQYLESRT